MNNCKSFKPSIDNNSKILILGSMPGVKSLEEQQYYAHSQNRFWKNMGNICNEPKLPEFDYDLKLKILLKNNIALWDTIKSCKRKGSLDSDIQNETPNDIRKLLKKYPNIKTICLNGNKSYTTFKKYFPDLLEKYSCHKMPSTSPANAKYSLDILIREWAKIVAK
ncbi:DNA-deoxyinosine glycosylase [bacterium]|nr:DNA-deoxyinosine glycosylase [bacterium]